MEQTVKQVYLSSLIAIILLSPYLKMANAFELVETGVSELSPNGKHVSVNVPGFFNMVLDTRGPNQGLRMTQNVLMGLVHLDLDRKRTPSGQFEGPIKVKVGGITMYDNKETI